MTFIYRKKLKYLYSAFLLLIICSNGVLSDSVWKFLEYPWKRLDYSFLNSADGIVVLSSGRHLPPGNTKIIEWYDPDRFIAGIELYKAKKSKKLIFTGGINPLDPKLPPEGDIYLNEAIAMGVPRNNILITYPVTNTFQEAKAIKKILKKELNLNQAKVILVTSAFHMKRAKKVFEKEGISILPYPVDFKSNESLFTSIRNPLKWLPSASHLSNFSSAFREIIGRIIYRSW